jgi:2,4-dienoyl-CoA reductase-like NADH-dependent reductase (Old Yellow Enzyme family)
MTVGQIQQVAEAFIRAAVRAEEAGFDGIQLHAAHGYLLSQFLSPYTNQREDAYGGDQERRSRLVVEILAGIKSKVKSDFIIGGKINGEDFVPGGLKPKDALTTARLMKRAGLDFIEVSGGMAESKLGAVRKGIDSSSREGYFRANSREIRNVLELPTACVGGFRSVSVMEDTIASGDADFISMCRPFIREPRLVARLKNEGRRKARCVSCNRCFNPRGLKCWQLAE